MSSIQIKRANLNEVKLENEQFFVEFISKYRSLPQLWDPSHDFYKNKYKRQEGYEELLEIFKKFDMEATRYHVRQKVNSLRSNYRKDLRRLLESKRILPNGKVVYDYKPSSWKFYALQFLDDIDLENDESFEPRIQEILIEDNQFEESSYDYGMPDEDPESQVFTETVETEVETTEPEESLNTYKITYIPSRKRKIKLEKGCESETLNSSDITNKEFDAIGANVALKLKRMNEQQRNHAELLINKVLINGLKNNLSEDTDLTDLQVLDVRNFED